MHTVSCDDPRLLNPYAILSILLLTSCAAHGERADPDLNGQALSSSPLSARDVALIEEAFHLQNRVGSSIWPTWSGGKAPFLYKTGSLDVLIDHPDPPDGFARTAHTLLGVPVWAKHNTKPESLRAARPINGVFTVVMSASEDGEDPCLWALKAAHELFHIHQQSKRSERIVEPFVGEHAKENELSFPFPYGEDAVTSLLRVEAEHVFTFVTAKTVTALDGKMTKRVLGHLDTVASAVFTDNSDQKYKKWMEWNEGVARYTERKIAAIAQDSTAYRSTASFAEQFPGARYTKTWEEHYARMLNPIRFVGEGVKGRVMFYYLGMGKACLLDRLNPTWREHYFDRDLDQLIAQ